MKNDNLAILWCFLRVTQFKDSIILVTLPYVTSVIVTYSSYTSPLYCRCPKSFVNSVNEVAALMKIKSTRWYGKYI